MTTLRFTDGATAGKRMVYFEGNGSQSYKVTREFYTVSPSGLVLVKSKTTRSDEWATYRGYLKTLRNAVLADATITHVQFRGFYSNGGAYKIDATRQDFLDWYQDGSEFKISG